MGIHLGNTAEINYRPGVIRQYNLDPHSASYQEDLFVISSAFSGLTAFVITLRGDCRCDIRSNEIYVGSVRSSSSPVCRNQPIPGYMNRIFNVASEAVAIWLR
jgi:hypothetical protein